MGKFNLRRGVVKTMKIPWEKNFILRRGDVKMIKIP